MDKVVLGKRKRFSYDAAFKLKVIKYAEENGGNRAAGREFSVSEKLVRDWRKAKVDIQQIPKTKRARRFTVSPFIALEKDIYKWICELRESGYVVTQLAIRVKALELSRSGKYENTDGFKGSVGWCCRFMLRNNLTLRQRTHIAQKLPRDVDDNVMLFKGL